MKAAFLARDLNTQSEGVRASVNLIVHAVDVSLFIMDYELDPRLIEDDEFMTWLEIFKDEMEAPVYTNVKENEKHGFIFVTTEEIGEKLSAFDLIIPFK